MFYIFWCTNEMCTNNVDNLQASWQFVSTNFPREAGVLNRHLQCSSPTYIMFFIPTCVSFLGNPLNTSSGATAMAVGDRTITRNKQFHYFNSTYFTKNPGTEGAILYKIRSDLRTAAALLRCHSACKWHHLICKPLATARCICIASLSAAYCPFETRHVDEFITIIRTP
jgi:hypothetical protein